MSHMMLSGAGPTSGGPGIIVPNQIADLDGWWRADVGCSPATNGVAVQTIADQSGFGNTYNQNTSARRPIFRTNIVGSLPALEFDGTDDRLQDVVNADLHVGSSVPQTIFVVVRVLQDKEHVPFCLTAFSSGISYLEFKFLADNSYQALMESVALDSGTDVSVDGLFHILTIDYDGTTLRTWLDSTAGATSTPTIATTDDASGTNGIGCHIVGGESLFFRGYFAEAIVYGRKLNDGERVGVWNWLRSRWETP